MTLISYGASVRTCLKAVEGLKVSVEVIDLRTLSPLDTETIISSVKKTGKAVIVHEAPKTLGLASEIIARINEKALYSLQAPVERVTGYDTVVPLRKFESYYVISEDRIRRSIERVIKNAV